MADYRLIHVGIWDDEWFVNDLGTIEKVLWTYLFSNRRVSVSGLYRIRDATIAEETNIPLPMVRAGMARFAHDGKIQRESDWVWVVKLSHYQLANSEKLKGRITKDLSQIPHCPIKTRYEHHKKTGEVIPQPTDTLPIPYRYPIHRMPRK